MRRLPLHPMLVHFPITFWCLAPLLGSAWLWGGVDELRAVAWWCALAGVISALPAIASGLFELTRLPDDDRAKGIALAHMMSLLATWLLALLALGATGPEASSGGSPRLWLALQWLVFSGVLVGGWLGGRLVYQHGAGRDAEPG